jgi:D-lactate dehydrogenase
MTITFFSTKSYDERYFDDAGDASKESPHEMVFHEAKLSEQTAALAKGSEAVCAFVNDHLDRSVLEQLHAGGTRYIAMRCAGFNNVDLTAAADLGLRVVRVPAYSPHAVAEHTLALLLTLNRRIHRAYNRIREQNFSLEGLVGFDVHGKTVGVIGTGQIGSVVARIFQGLGCQVLCFDIEENEELKAAGCQYLGLDDLLGRSDIITLHCPLNESTFHMIDGKAIDRMQKGVTLLNTSRGGLIETRAAIDGLKSGQIGNLAIDVYEEEDNLFFEDKSSDIMQDDDFARLLAFPNVLITGHQAFLTHTALSKIARVTRRNPFPPGVLPARREPPATLRPAKGPPLHWAVA